MILCLVSYFDPLSLLAVPDFMYSYLPSPCSYYTNSFFFRNYILGFFLTVILSTHFSLLYSLFSFLERRFFFNLVFLRPICNLGCWYILTFQLLYYTIIPSNHEYIYRAVIENIPISKKNHNWPRNPFIFKSGIGKRWWESYWNRFGEKRCWIGSSFVGGFDAVRWLILSRGFRDE